MEGVCRRVVAGNKSKYCTNSSPLKSVPQFSQAGILTIEDSFIFLYLHASPSPSPSPSTSILTLTLTLTLTLNLNLNLTLTLNLTQGAERHGFPDRYRELINGVPTIQKQATTFTKWILTPLTFLVVILVMLMIIAIAMLIKSVFAVYCRVVYPKITREKVFDDSKTEIAYLRDRLKVWRCSSSLAVTLLKILWVYGKVCDMLFPRTCIIKNFHYDLSYSE